MSRQVTRAAIVMLAAGLALVAFKGQAAAQGLVLDPSELPAKVRTQLEDQIDAARAADPTPFQRLKALRAKLQWQDARKQGPAPVVMPTLTALGPQGLLPMLERLVFAAEPRYGLSDGAWTAWRGGLLEAVGRLRDPRAAPVLYAVLHGSNDEYLVVYSAAAAYGNLSTDVITRQLIQLSKRQGPKQLPVLAALGHCRRLAVARRLADAMAATSDPLSARLLARALGDIGSAWAWKTPAVPYRHEQMDVRRTAAEALVAAFPGWDHHVRQKLTAAVLVVDHPATLDLIAAQKATASGDAYAALEELGRRFLNSPFHRP